MWRMNTLDEQANLIKSRKAGGSVEYRTRSQPDQWHPMISGMQFNFQGCQYRPLVPKVDLYVCFDEWDGFHLTEEEQSDNLGLLKVSGTDIQFFKNRNRSAHTDASD